MREALVGMLGDCRIFKYQNFLQGLADISVCRYFRPILAGFLNLEKNASASDLTWCNYVVCPAEGSLLCKNLEVKRFLFSALMFEKSLLKCEISCLHYISLSQVFDYPIQIFRIQKFRIFLLTNIRIVIGTKIPYRSGPTNFAESKRHKDE